MTLLDDARRYGYDVDPLWEVARTGRYRGKVANIGWAFARRNNGWNGTTERQDVADYLGTSTSKLTPTVLGTPYYLVSTSASDGVGGIGIQTMRVNCLVGASLTRSIRTITLDGTTPVLLGSDVAFVQYMESGTVGSTGYAVGDVYCSSKSTAGVPAVSECIDMVRVGSGRSASGRIMVPGGFSCYMLGWHASAVNTTMDVHLSATAYTDNRALSPGFHFQETAWLGAGSNFTDALHFLPMPPGVIIKLNAIPGAQAAGNRCEGSFHFALIEG